MVVFVDLEHDRRYADPVHGPQALAARQRARRRLAAAAGRTCLVVRYDRVSPDLLNEWRAQAVVVSGCFTDFEHYAPGDLAGLNAVFCEAARPILGICGAHQLMAQAWGGTIGPMGPLPAGAAEPPPEARPDGYVPGMQQERGFREIEVREAHPLLAGLGGRPAVFQAHYWEVKSLPPDFGILAESEACRVQVIAHASRPLFGTQFHPERYDEQNPAGRQLLESFFRIAYG